MRWLGLSNSRIELSERCSVGLARDWRGIGEGLFLARDWRAGNFPSAASSTAGQKIFNFRSSEIPLVGAACFGLDGPRSWPQFLEPTSDFIISRNPKLAEMTFEAGDPPNELRVADYRSW